MKSASLPLALDEESTLSSAIAIASKLVLTAKETCWGDCAGLVIGCYVTPSGPRESISTLDRSEISNAFDPLRSTKARFFFLGEGQTDEKKPLMPVASTDPIRQRLIEARACSKEPLVNTAVLSSSMFNMKAQALKIVCRPHVFTPCCPIFRYKYRLLCHPISGDISWKTIHED